MFNLGEISMKKSFIALAVLAAAGVASAQSSVSLSGNYTFGFKSTKTGSVKASGLGTDTAAVKFAATEDLGGGLKASAQVTAAGLNRGKGVEGEDAKLDLMGGFGTLTLGSVEIGNSIFRSQAGGPTFNFDSDIDAGVLEGAVKADILKYTSPNLGGLTFNATYFDGGVAPAPTGLGAGTTGGGDKQPGLMFGADYANGPIDAGVDFTAFQKKNVAQYAGGEEKSRLRVSGSYDLGVVKLGAGFARYNYNAGLKSKTETAFGVSAPLGPVSVGAYFARAKQDTVKANGFSLGAKYDLSKRTNVTGKLGNWKNSNGSTSVKSNRFELLVGHSF
jgi:predicted porin